MNKKPVKVLVVDDEEIIRDFLSRLLSLENVEVKTVSEGSGAVELARAEHFDIFFIDMRMPKMDGVETLKALKEITPQAKYVMMTGYSLDDMLKKLDGTDIESILTKPFEIKEIVAILDDYIRNKFPDEIISVLIVENEEVVSRFFAKLLQNYNVTSVKTAAEALEEVSRNNFDLILSDIMLKDMSGTELYGKIREIKPASAIILVTGDVKKTEGIIKDNLRQQIKSILNK